MFKKYSYYYTDYANKHFPNLTEYLISIKNMWVFILNKFSAK